MTLVNLICEKKLIEELSDFYSNIEDEVIRKLKDLCVIHDLTEDVICAELLSFVIKFDRNELNAELIDEFKTEYLDKKAVNDYKKLKLKSNRAQNNTHNSSFNANKSLNSLLNDYSFECLNTSSVKPKITTQIEIASNDETEVLTPTQPKEVVKTPKKINRNECLDVSSQSSPIDISEDTINTSLKYSQNSNILCYFGNSCSDFEWINKSKAQLNVEPFDKTIALTENFKFMSLKISESNEILNDIIDEFSEDIRQKLEIEGWNRFSIVSPTESYYIGRVCHDFFNNKLDEHSIRLETSHYISKNESIALHLNHLKSYSLFPGEVIACKAINESGKSLFVEEIIDFSQILSLPKTLPSISQSLHLVVGVGPFTVSKSLDLKPLKKLMKYVNETKPDFCILIGPFVDSLNEKLLTIEEPIDRFFSSQMRLISELLKDVKTEAIVIPSTRDLNVFNVLPTMPFNSFKSSKIHYFSNPTLININGVIIGLTATDVLLHLSQQEISAGQISDRMSRLCKHILNQRNFYPIFPPNPEINVEFTKYDYLSLRVTPHILLLPSDLKEFIKNISGSVVINSGRLFKDKFARIKVDPINEKTFNGSLESYTSVEIVKME